MRKLLAPVAAVALVLSMTTVALAWRQPTLEALCAPDANSFAWKIHLTNEKNFKLDGSFESDFSPRTTVNLGSGSIPFDRANFGSSGDHTFTTPRGGSTLYVRWSDDRSSKTSKAANTTLCAPPLVPGIEITKTDNAASTVIPGAVVTYTYQVKNTGNVPLSNVVVTDKIDLSESIACAVNSSLYTGDNGNGILDPGETWTFTCSVALQVTTTNKACVTTKVGQAPSVGACATDKVDVSPSPTQQVQAATGTPVPTQKVQAATGTPAATLTDTSTEPDGSSPLPAIFFALVLAGSLGALGYANVKVVAGPKR